MLIDFLGPGSRGHRLCGPFSLSSSVRCGLRLLFVNFSNCLAHMICRGMWWRPCDGRRNCFLWLMWQLMLADEQHCHKDCQRMTDKRICKWNYGPNDLNKPFSCSVKFSGGKRKLQVLNQFRHDNSITAHLTVGQRCNYISRFVECLSLYGNKSCWTLVLFGNQTIVNPHVHTVKLASQYFFCYTIDLWFTIFSL